MPLPTASWGATAGGWFSVSTSAPARHEHQLRQYGHSLGTDTLDPAPLKAEASGTTFSQIELAGYSGYGNSAMLVEDDVFKHAAIGA